jgi:hypothetical protein
MSAVFFGVSSRRVTKISHDHKKQKGLFIYFQFLFFFNFFGAKRRKNYITAERREAARSCVYIFEKKFIF